MAYGRTGKGKRERRQGVNTEDENREAKKTKARDMSMS